MRKSAVIILIGAFGAAVAIAASSSALMNPHPFVALSWLSAIFAFAVFGILMVQHTIYERPIYLYLSLAFLALGITGIRESMVFPSQIDIPSAENGYFALWQLGWITLAGILIWGMSMNRSIGQVQFRPSFILYVTSSAAIWASFLILLTALFPNAMHKAFGGEVGMVMNILCCCIFTASIFAYSRQPMHKDNSVILWMSYGLIFAALAQIIMVADIPLIENYRFAIASLFKTLMFFTPVIGMLAEHTRLQLKMHEQSTDFNYLVQMQQAVTTVTSASDLYQRVVELVSFSFSAGAVCLMPFDYERSLLYVASRIGFDDEVTKRLVFRPGEGKAGECFSRQELIYARDVFTDPVMNQKLYGVVGIGSAVFAPLMLKENCIGVLAIFFGGKPLRYQKFPKEQMKMLDALSTQAALALDLHQMRNKIITTAKATDDHARELEIVAEIGKSISSELEIESLVDTLSDSLRSAVGARTCTILIYDPDTADVKIMGKRRLSRYSSLSEHTDSCDITAAMVAQTNEPKIFNNIPNSSHCKFPEMNVDDDGTHHFISVPMRLPGFYGAINVFRQNAEPFGEREKRIMMRLAPIVATSIRNAELYERERKIAESLQQSFLPELTDGSDIEIQSHYVAAFDESLVGGDFYDLIKFEDGKYGIVIGDVSGKGLDAAVYTAMTRYMIEAYSYDDPDPLYVISKLNYAMCKYTPVGKFVTVVYGILDTKAATFSYVNAGHELPFLRKNRDNRIETMKSTGPAVGALLEAEYRTEKIPFKQGDMLILYTDGATDVRHEGKFLGVEGFYKIVADQIKANNGELKGLAKSIVDNVSEYSNGYLRDDIAILAIKSKVTTALF